MPQVVQAHKPSDVMRAALRFMLKGRAHVQDSGVHEAAWWAVGDTPPRTGCLVEPLIDGRAAMYAMCRAFLSAKQYILLAGWDIAADLPLVRGGDLRLGSDDSPQQRSLVAYLREGGMDDEALALWNA